MIKIENIDGIFRFIDNVEIYIKIVIGCFCRFISYYKLGAMIEDMNYYTSLILRSLVFRFEFILYI